MLLDQAERRKGTAEDLPRRRKLPAVPGKVLPVLLIALSLSGAALLYLALWLELV